MTATRVWPSRNTSSARAGPWKRSGGAVRKKNPPAFAAERSSAVAEPLQSRTPAVSTLSSTDRADAEVAGPSTASTRSDSMSWSRAAEVTAGSAPSSRTTRSTGEPFTPPASLISSTPMRTASVTELTMAAIGPVSGAR